MICWPATIVSGTPVGSRDRKDRIRSAWIAFESIWRAVAGPVVEEWIGIRRVEEESDAPADHRPGAPAWLIAEAHARAEAGVVGLVDVADVRALEHNPGRRCARTEHREVLLAVVHRLHVVVAQSEIEVESEFEAGSCPAQKKSNAIGIDRALRIAHHDGAFGQIACHEVGQRGHVGIESMSSPRSIGPTVPLKVKDPVEWRQ